MSLKYKKIGATTGGYRGERAVLQERVIEGLVQPTFNNGILQLTPDSQQTQYLTTSNTSTGFFIVLPSGTDLWNNWQIAIINNSSVPVNIYYYTSNPSDSGNLHLFKELAAGNMLTAILLDNTTEQGTWTTLRTNEAVSSETVYQYTSNIFETFSIPFDQLHGATYYAYVPTSGSNVYTKDNPIGTTSILYNSSLVALDPQPAFTVGEDNTIVINDGTDDITYTLDESQNITATSTSVPVNLSTIPVGTAVRSIYFKPDIQFTGSTLTMSIGTQADDDLFYEDIDITGAVSNTNFGKDLFERILSNDSDLQLIATFNGSNLNNLTAGNINITIERTKLIDPTILKNAIVNTTVPTGSIFNYAFRDIPAGYMRLDGSQVANANETIPQFVQFLTKNNNQMTGTEKLIVGIDEWYSIFNTYGSCGKFAWNGTALKFPAINCFIRGIGNNISSLGKFVDDTMRPITGKASQNIQGASGKWGGGISEGALEWIDSRGDASWEDNATGYSGIRLNSAKLGPNYAGKETAPKHILYPYIMAVSNKIQWTSQIDYDNLIAASVYKADTNLSNINTTTDILNNSLPSNMDYIIESWRDGVNWYRIYKSGWVEQGGQVFISYNGQPINLWITMADSNYSITTSSTAGRFASASNPTTTGFVAYTGDDGSFNSGLMRWEVKGYKAQ